MDEVKLGQRIAHARKSSGMTQQELCHQTGISYSTLAKIERGAIKSPSVFTVSHIAQLTKTSVEELVGSISTIPNKIIDGSRTSQSGISFVYFDINGCMVRFFQRAFMHIAGDYGVSPDLVEATFWHYNDAVCRGDMNFDAFNQVFAERLRADNFDWAHYYLDNIDPILEMHECAKQVSTEFRVGLLSNIMPTLIDHMRARNLIPSIDYDCIIDSSSVGAIKPETKIYEIAAEKAGVSPNSILLVDDSRTNLMAAERLGWHVLWFDDFHAEESTARIKAALL